MTINSSSLGSLLKYLQIIFFVSVIFYFGRILFVPIFYGLFIAIVLYPLCKWLERHRWPRSLAILGGLLIVILLFSLLVWLLLSEINALQKDLPELQIKLQPSLLQLQLWIENNLGISVVSQIK